MSTPAGLSGYALKWGELSRYLPPEFAAGSHRPAAAFRERFQAGAFDAFLGRVADGKAVVALRADHDGDQLASSHNGGLRVWSDAYGLAFSARFDAQPRYPAAEVSISFTAEPGAVTWSGDVCTIKRGTLAHVAMLDPGNPLPAAYPHALAWFTAWDGEHSPHVLSLMARHRVGQARARLRAIEAKATRARVTAHMSRRAPPLPPHIVAILRAELGNRYPE